MRRLVMLALVALCAGCHVEVRAVQPGVYQTGPGRHPKSSHVTFVRQL